MFGHNLLPHFPEVDNLNGRRALDPNNIAVHRVELNITYLYRFRVLYFLGKDGLLQTQVPNVNLVLVGGGDKDVAGLWFP